MPTLPPELKRCVPSDFSEVAAALRTDPQDVVCEGPLKCICICLFEIRLRSFLSNDQKLVFLLFASIYILNI